MRKYFCLLFLFLLLVMSSCQAPQPVKKVEAIRISGSSTCLPLIKILAKEFQRKNQEVKFDFLPGVHSGGGIKGVAQGTLDIGTVSRELKEEEKKLNLKYYCLSNDGLAIGTSKDVNIAEVTSQELKDIYSGKISNWQELGGPNEEIVVLDRSEDESAKIILRKFILGQDLKITPKHVVLYFESEMIEAMKNTPYSIGYFSLGYALSTNLDVNLLKLDGVEPTVENILVGKYRVTRPLGIVVKQEKGAIRNFIKFLLSKEARKIMIKKGFAPAKI